MAAAPAGGGTPGSGAAATATAGVSTPAAESKSSVRTRMGKVKGAARATGGAAAAAEKRADGGAVAGTASGDAPTGEGGVDAGPSRMDQMENWKRKIKYLETIAATNPSADRSAALFRKLARARYRLWLLTVAPAEIPQVQKAYADALRFRVNADMPELWDECMRVYMAFGAYDGAIQLAQRVVLDFPQFADLARVMFTAAACYRRLKQYDAAMTYLLHLINGESLPRGYPESEVITQLAWTYEQKATALAAAVKAKDKAAADAAEAAARTREAREDEEAAAASVAGSDSDAGSSSVVRAAEKRRRSSAGSTSKDTRRRRRRRDSEVATAVVLVGATPAERAEVDATTELARAAWTKAFETARLENMTADTRARIIAEAKASVAPLLAERDRLYVKGTGKYGEKLAAAKARQDKEIVDKAIAEALSKPLPQDTALWWRTGQTEGGNWAGGGGGWREWRRRPLTWLRRGKEYSTHQDDLLATECYSEALLLRESGGDPDADPAGVTAALTRPWKRRKGRNEREKEAAAKAAEEAAKQKARDERRARREAKRAAAEAARVEAERRAKYGIDIRTGYPRGVLHACGTRAPSGEFLLLKVALVPAVTRGASMRASRTLAAKAVAQAEATRDSLGQSTTIVVSVVTQRGGKAGKLAIKRSAVVSAALDHGFWPHAPLPAASDVAPLAGASDDPSAGAAAPSSDASVRGQAEAAPTATASHDGAARGTATTDEPALASSPPGRDNGRGPLPEAVVAAFVQRCLVIEVRRKRIALRVTASVAVAGRDDDETTNAAADAEAPGAGEEGTHGTATPPSSTGRDAAAPAPAAPLTRVVRSYEYIEGVGMVEEAREVPVAEAEAADAATAIQGMVRGATARRLVAAAHASQRDLHSEAASQIQRMARSHSARMFVVHVREDMSALRIQRLARAKSAWGLMARLKEDEDKMAALMEDGMVEPSYDDMTQDERNEEADAWMAAATAGLRTGDTVFLTKAAEKAVAMMGSADDLSAAQLAVLAHSKSDIVQKMVLSRATFILAIHTRMFLARRRKFYVQTAAATVIQRKYRAYWWRTWAWRRQRRKHRGATGVQAAWRFYRDRKRFAGVRAVKVPAILLIQCAYRRMLAWRRVARKRLLRDALPVLRVHWGTREVLRFMKMFAKRTYYLRCRRAALAVTCAWRQYLARGRLRWLRDRWDEVTQKLKVREWNQVGMTVMPSHLVRRYIAPNSSLDGIAAARRREMMASKGALGSTSGTWDGTGVSGGSSGGDGWGDEGVRDPADVLVEDLGLDVGKALAGRAVLSDEQVQVLGMKGPVVDVEALDTDRTSVPDDAEFAHLNKVAVSSDLPSRVAAPATRVRPLSAPLGAVRAGAARRPPSAPSTSRAPTLSASGQHQLRAAMALEQQKHVHGSPGSRARPHTAATARGRRGAQSSPQRRPASAAAAAGVGSRSKGFHEGGPPRIDMPPVMSLSSSRAWGGARALVEQLRKADEMAVLREEGTLATLKERDDARRELVDIAHRKRAQEMAGAVATFSGGGGSTLSASDSALNRSFARVVGPEAAAAFAATPHGATLLRDPNALSSDPLPLAPELIMATQTTTVQSPSSALRPRSRGGAHLSASMPATPRAAEPYNAADYDNGSAAHYFGVGGADVDALVPHVAPGSHQGSAVSRATNDALPPARRDVFGIVHAPPSPTRTHAHAPPTGVVGSRPSAASTVGPWAGVSVEGGDSLVSRPLSAPAGHGRRDRRRGGNARPSRGVTPADAVASPLSRQEQLAREGVPPAAAEHGVNGALESDFSATSGSHERGGATPPQDGAPTPHKDIAAADAREAAAAAAHKSAVLSTRTAPLPRPGDIRPSLTLRQKRTKGGVDHTGRLLGFAPDAASPVVDFLSRTVASQEEALARQQADIDASGGGGEEELEGEGPEFDGDAFVATGPSDGRLGGGGGGGGGATASGLLGGFDASVRLSEASRALADDPLGVPGTAHALSHGTADLPPLGGESVFDEFAQRSRGALEGQVSAGSGATPGSVQRGRRTSAFTVSDDFEESAHRAREKKRREAEAAAADEAARTSASRSFRQVKPKPVPVLCQHMYDNTRVVYTRMLETLATEVMGWIRTDIDMWRMLTWRRLSEHAKHARTHHHKNCNPEVCLVLVALERLIELVRMPVSVTSDSVVRAIRKYVRAFEPPEVREARLTAAARSKAGLLAFAAVDKEVEKLRAQLRRAPGQFAVVRASYHKLLVHKLRNREWAQGARLLRHMMSEPGMVPSAATLHSAAELCAAPSAPGNCLRLRDDPPKATEDQLPGDDTPVGLALRIVEWFKEIGAKPDVRLFNFALGAVDASSDWRDAMRVYAAARQAKVKPNAVTHEYMVKIGSRASKGERPQVYEHYVEVGVPFDVSFKMAADGMGSFLPEHMGVSYM